VIAIGTWNMEHFDALRDRRESAVSSDRTSSIGIGQQTRPVGWNTAGIDDTMTFAGLLAQYEYL
jgi:hypothetical protein